MHLWDIIKKYIRETEIASDILSPMNRGASAVNAGCQTHVWSSTD